MDSSVLFSGVRFDKNRFGTDVRRFKKNAEVETPKVHADSLNGHSGEYQPGVTAESSELRGNVKKKKKKVSNSSTENGTGDVISFNVFQPVPEIDLPDDIPDEIPAPKQNGKSKARLEEEVGALRKKFRLHVAGQSIPPPLKDFQQLRTQYPIFNALYEPFVFE
ncbi:unnamed protein product [Calypogeia fissa]